MGKGRSDTHLVFVEIAIWPIGDLAMAHDFSNFIDHLIQPSLQLFVLIGGAFFQLAKILL